MVYGHTLEAPYPLTQQLARKTLKEMNEIEYHNLLCATCLLHRGFMNFDFVCKETAAKL